MKQLRERPFLTSGPASPPPRPVLVHMPTRDCHKPSPLRLISWSSYRPCGRGASETVPFEAACTSGTHVRERATAYACSRCTGRFLPRPRASSPVHAHERVPGRLTHERGAERSFLGQGGLPEPTICYYRRRFPIAKIPMIELP